MLLPTEGRVAWSVRIIEGSTSAIGVCNDTYAWGLYLGTATIKRFHSTNGFFILDKDETRILPEGWPADSLRIEMIRADGKPAGLGLQHTYQGAVIEVIMDKGSLAFGINGDPPIRVPNFAFPPGTRLRPWVRMLYDDDHVRLASPFVRYCE